MTPQVIPDGNFLFPQYLSVNTANEYFYQRLNSNVWFQANEQDQNAALIQSTRAIDNLSFLGVKLDPNQKLSFPRWQPSALATANSLDGTWVGNYYYVGNVPPLLNPDPLPAPNPGVPQDILVACCENAIVLLDGFDFEIELTALNTQTSAYASVRETYDRNLVVTHLRSGIASGLAWTFLKPWLQDTNSFTLSRVN